MAGTDDALRREKDDAWLRHQAADHDALGPFPAFAAAVDPLFDRIAALQAERDADKSCIAADQVQISYLNARLEQAEAHIAALRAPSSAEAMREAAARVADVEGKHGEGWDGQEMARTIAATIRALPLSPDPGSAPVEGWRDMASAPRDGTLFLMWLPGDDDLGYVPTVHVGFRARCGDVHSAGMCMHMEDGIQPTHWRPLPPPPAEPSRDAQKGERS